MKNAKNEENISPDDPRLTAYALGELEDEERAAIEVILANDATARGVVEAVRALAEQMTSALAEEPAPVTAPKPVAAPLRPAAIVNGHDPSKVDGGNYRSSRKLIRFPQFYYVISGLAAACFVMVMALRKPEPPPLPKKYYREITLPPLTTQVAMPSQTVAEASSPAAAGDTPAGDNVQSSASVATNPSNDARFSLLNQAKNDNSKFSAASSRALSWSYGTGGAPQNKQPPVSFSATRDVGRMAVQPVSLTASSGSGRTYTYPQDDKFVITVVPSPRDLGDVITAQPKPPTVIKPNGSASLAFGAGRGGLLDFAATADRARRGLLAGSSWMDFAPVGDVRRPDELAPVPELSRSAANTEAYAYVQDNDFLGAAQNPLSTFSVDVDTASYANVRRFLQNGQRPPVDAIRIEELVNYFPYRYAPPSPAAAPIAAHLEVAAAPWAAGHRLVRIGLKGREVAVADRRPANLVFLIDVSGSMNEPNKLPLVKESMRLLVGKLRPDDRVAIVTYAGNSGLALPSTPVTKTREILAALDELTPGGSTNGGMGIELAYDLAKANFVPGGINRVILCTDGDFNVGVTSEGELTRLVAEKAKSGVFLTALGFGMGNFKDATIEKLADHGNGNYGYIDSRREAEKLLVQEVSGTLLTIAKDVKVQVDFNPAVVASYRLIGYENRLLKKEDFNNDQVDAGEIGAGHSVTALYEIVPVGVELVPAGSVEESKYAPAKSLATVASAASGELLTVTVRYKEPEDDVSREIKFPLTDSGASFAAASPDFKFAAAVASFGMILRDSPHKGLATLDQVAAWAAAGTDEDVGGWKSEFIDLTRMAKGLL